jgi:hypothetical protein
MLIFLKLICACRPSRITILAGAGRRKQFMPLWNIELSILNVSSKE